MHYDARPHGQPAGRACVEFELFAVLFLAKSCLYKRLGQTTNAKAHNP